MTAATDPDADPPSSTATFLSLDIAAIHRSVEQITRQVDEQIGGPVDESGLIDRIAGLESLQNAVAALQSATVYAFAKAHAASRIARGEVDPKKIERSIVGEIGPACRVSPTEAGKRMRMARDLRCGLNHVRALFGAGELSAYRTATIVTACSHLDAAERAEADELLAAHGIAGLGVGKLRELARSSAAQVAPEKFRARWVAARTGRRVTLRPSADGMTDLIAHLPAEQGAACLAALHRAFIEASVNPAPMTRGRGQVMADALVERLTGQARAEDVNVEVQIVVPVESLVDDRSPLPARIPGHGPVPAELLATGRGRRAWRRLVTRNGIVIGGDSRRRRFTGFLAELIKARDGHRCSEPFCDAPFRETDHIRRWADGGRTDAGNGRSVCAFHNHLREQLGWRVTRTPLGVRTTTPTGHHYLARPTPITAHDASRKQIRGRPSGELELTGGGPDPRPTSRGCGPRPARCRRRTRAAIRTGRRCPAAPPPRARCTVAGAARRPRRS